MNGHSDDKLNGHDSKVNGHGVEKMNGHVHEKMSRCDAGAKDAAKANGHHAPKPKGALPGAHVVDALNTSHRMDLGTPKIPKVALKI